MLMKRKLIIHIGMGKTGSTSIQRTLRRAQDSLNSQGVHYLGLMLEHAPSDDFYPWQVDSGWAAYLRLDKEIANQQLLGVLTETDKKLPSEIHTLVWSNESLFDGASLVLSAIESAREIFDIEIVGYIRRPDSWVTSAYLQWGIKHKSYPGPLKPFRNWAGGMGYSVMPKIKSWEAMGDSIKFFNFDAISDIAEHFNTTLLPEATNGISPFRANETPPSVAMAFFAYYNSLSEGQVLPSELEPLLNRSGIYSSKQKVRPYNNMLPNELDIKNYLQQNAEEISKLNTYFEAHNEPVFDLSEPKVKDYSTNQHEINRGLLQMIKHLFVEIDMLKNKLKKQDASND
jgi:hypothetical protein